VAIARETAQQVRDDTGGPRDGPERQSDKVKHVLGYQNICLCDLSIEPEVCSSRALEWRSKYMESRGWAHAGRDKLRGTSKALEMDQNGQATMSSHFWIANIVCYNKMGC
jgi:hypothetical protein